MKLNNKVYFSVFILLVSFCFAQSELRVANIGNFKTTEGKIIRDCKIGYRTSGRLNSDSSNVLLLSTWFTGTTKDLYVQNNKNGWIDTSKYFIIYTDALSNGVSSSPSNSEDFPEISIPDMVNTQYKLLSDHLKIKKVKAVIGISMGGMQVFEWILSYPNFMEKAIAIAGTPKFSSYDLILWQTQADLIQNGLTGNENMDELMKSVYDLFYLNCYTPEFFINNIKPDSISTWRENSYKSIINPKNYLSQLNAMIRHDVYKNHSVSLEEIKNRIKPELLIITSKKDQAVNPVNADEFGKTINCKMAELTGDCGHIAVWCESKKVKKEISEFLK